MSLTDQNPCFLAKYLIEKGEKTFIWGKTGQEEVGKRFYKGEMVVKIDSQYFRPTEVKELLGDASKACEKLDLKISLSLGKLIFEMIMEDLNKARKEYLLKGKGFSLYDPKK